MYKPCPVMMDNNGFLFQYFPAADVARHHKWMRDDDPTWGDRYATDEE